MAYETFFKNKERWKSKFNIPTDKIAEISDFGNTIYNLSNNIQLFMEFYQFL